MIFFFSQNTFFGRFRHFLDVIDPSTLFVTEVHMDPSFSLCLMRTVPIEYVLLKFSLVLLFQGTDGHSLLRCPEDLSFITPHLISIQLSFFLHLSDCRKTGHMCKHTPQSWLLALSVVMALKYYYFCYFGFLSSEL